MVDGITGKREDGALPALDAGLRRVILVGAGEERYTAELGRLATTLGLEVVGVVEQNRRDNTGYIGRGKRLELAEEIRRVEAGMVVTDDELTASQSRVLEADCEAPVIDRTELIIRIFHEHARDAPSKLQVELAELSYLLPRIRGMWHHLERLGGGSAGSAGSSGSSAAGGRATRGPGEQQLEYDRRQIRTRMERLKKRLDDESASRRTRRARLKSSEIPKVALVGYTNAGKTTVLNALSGADRIPRDRLFETLETTTRKVEGEESENPSGKADQSPGHSLSYSPGFTVTDTVGFIRKLPTQLVESFSSTLEAADDADILVICADASSPDLEEEIQTVKNTLSLADLADGNGKLPGRNGRGDALKRSKSNNTQGTGGSKPVILLLNKGDLLTEDEISELGRSFPEGLVLDHGSGYGALKGRIFNCISEMRNRMRLLIPHGDYSEVTRLYGLATIHERVESEAGVILDVSLPEEVTKEYERYLFAYDGEPPENNSR